MHYLPLYTMPGPPSQPPSFPSPGFLPRDSSWRHTLATHLDSLAPETRVAQRTQSAYAILALCAGLTAAASGPAFSDEYDDLVEGFDMCASDGSGSVGIAGGFIEPLVPLLEHVAKEGKLPTLHQAIPSIGDILAQSAALFITADPDLHPGYLAEGCWRLFAHIGAFEADEAAHLVSLIGADVQANLGVSDVLLHEADPASSANPTPALPTIMPIFVGGPPLGTADEEATIDRLTRRRTRVLDQPGEHAIELAWIAHRLAAVERSIQFLQNYNSENRDTPRTTVGRLVLKP